MSIYDIIVIGGGPIGLACGIEAQKAGLKYLILEKGALVNSIYNYPLNMRFFSTSERLEIGAVPFVSISGKPMRDEALEYYRRVLEYFRLKIKLYEEVQIINRRNDGLFEIQSSKGIYHSKHIIIATGFYDHPISCGIDGEHMSKVFHYYKEPHPFSFSKIIVVGAANSAIDAALECYRKGAEVTLVVRKPEISHRVKYWVKPDIENRIKENSIKALFNAELVSIRENEVNIKTENGIVTLENDFVLLMTGYHPDFSLLAKVGIEFHSGDLKIPNYNEDTMESNIKNIYLAGVVCGGMETHKWFIENSRIHANMIIRDILSKANFI
ncbi:FAD-dependent pyridine nucleotide-disulfide oxidoreductase [Sporocytophaga myxococcoides]|uniref:FAD-dependent pyridine nucleotide-disulfide oxidoreductase n=1 Tax=Sporocytophaga myxococcoides TaxID=153721 RepID=A0A098L8D9_9BACT|nr:YpdA family putative bacillithiol disulfide reductase [Sporocytophaga myxococcoides]GAL82980.1 FAD-dependent pyridine nucleotide-disulfide oxidoreductase [Sporocytophaga myxococcoides]